MHSITKSAAHRARTTAHSFFRLAWSRLTDIPFLTLLIAVGTLATAGVAYRTALDSHEQVQLLKRQVGFNAIETRPFLRLKSSISNEKPISAYLHLINVGRIPARVIAYDMVVQLGRRTIEPKGGTFNTQDVLYPDQPGLGVFQTLSEGDANSFERSGEPIVIGGCAIYASVSTDDPRRWKVSAAYRHDASSGLPTGLFAKEVDVPSDGDRCDASLLRTEWASQLKTYPR